MGKYVCNFEERTNCIKMVLSGFFTGTDAENYVRDLVKETYRVKNFVKSKTTGCASDIYLELDSILLGFYPCDVKAKLKGVFELYKHLGYKLIRLKLNRPQKELARKFGLLCEEIGLNWEVMFV